MPALDDHPLAAIFPLMDDADLKALSDDITANGLREAVWLYEGKILDGRNRYRACVLADIDHRVEYYKGADPLGFVISKNLHRRHLTESQRAMVAANIATAKKGKPANLPVKPVTQSQAADLVNVAERSVRDAVKVKEKGTPELVKAVESGDIPVSTAAKVADLPKSEQKKVAKADDPKKAAKKATAKKQDDEPDEADSFVEQVGALCRDIDQVAGRMKELKKSKYCYSTHVDSAVQQVEAARKTLWQGRPTDACPYCKANETDGCKTCNGTRRVKKATADRGREAVGK